MNSKIKFVYEGKSAFLEKNSYFTQKNLIICYLLCNAIVIFTFFSIAIKFLTTAKKTLFIGIISGLILSCLFLIFLITFLIYLFVLNHKKNLLLKKISGNDKAGDIYLFNKSKIIKKLANVKNYKKYGNFSKVNNLLAIKSHKNFLFLYCIIFITLFQILLLVLNLVLPKNFLLIANFFAILINNLFSPLLFCIINKTVPSFPWETKINETEPYKELIKKILKFIVVSNKFIEKNKKMNVTCRNELFPNYFMLVENEEIVRQELKIWNKYFEELIFHNIFCALKIINWLFLKKTSKI